MKERNLFLYEEILGGIARCLSHPVSEITFFNNFGTLEGQYLSSL